MTEAPIPPKPAAREGRASLWRRVRMFRRDILSAQPERLYRAWMAEFRAPFLRSYLCNDPDLVERVLRTEPETFPKSDRVREGLAPLLGRAVFVTNGAEWRRQRRLIDPAFEGGRLRDTFPAILAAAEAARDRLARRAGSVVEIEEEASHAAADVIFRTLFSIPIEDATAAEVYRRFRAFQRAQPLINLAAFLRLPRWVPRLHRRAYLREAREIRALIARLVEDRARLIARGAAPDDLATKIMTARDAETGAGFGAAEMVDQVAIFFLAGHETSAAALGWALYLLATHPAVQEGVAREAQEMAGPIGGIADAGRLMLSRDVFREALRLYAPVPMMVREARCPVSFRGREVPAGSQIVLSPWHLGRHQRIWDRPDAFDPGRWQTEAGRAQARRGFLPFSAGPRVCPGAGLAMIEGPVMLSVLCGSLRFSPAAGRTPVPVAHLTVRSEGGIHLKVEARPPLT